MNEETRNFIERLVDTVVFGMVIAVVVIAAAIYFK